jgi:FtsZ-binding cell division protein ZapB
MPRKKEIANAVDQDAEMFHMPQKVKEWIDRAGSIMTKQKTEIEELKKENKELKAYQQWAQAKILNVSREDD